MDLLTVFVTGLLILVISVCIGIWIQMALEYYCQYKGSLDDEEEVGVGIIQSNLELINPESPLEPRALNDKSTTFPTMSCRSGKHQRPVPVGLERSG